MKKRCLALLAAACLLLGLLPVAAAAQEPLYDDVRAGDWFYDSVAYVTQRGLMTGTGDGCFQPDTACDRAMFVTVLHRMESAPQVDGVSFLDVPDGAYYTAAVSWARARQIVKGYGDGRFGPNDPLTREQMMVILHRYAQDQGYDVSASDLLADFSDAAQIASYARQAMEWGVAKGLITGTGGGLLDPRGMVTRAQIAAILARFGALADAATDDVEAQRLVLRDFSASQTALAASDGASVTFTVRPSRRVYDLTLRRDDGVVLGAMNDDGQDGDSVAGDGVYTYVWAVGKLSAGTYSCYAATGSVESRPIAITLAAGGVITGRVHRAEDRAALPGAVLKVYLDGLLCTTATANAVGGYSLYLPAGNYHIAITCEGYVPFNAYAVVTGGSESYNETYLLVSGVAGQPGSASGMVTSAVTGKGMAEVQLEVREGWNNTGVGDVVATATTDAAGRYALDLPLGNYTVLASRPGCIPVSFNIVSTAAGARNQNGSITPVVDGNVYRVVLTWGELPSDMDSHMVGPDDQGRQFHVNFESGGVPGPGGTYICNLDVDDTNSYGPETITLDPQPDSTYYYYVQRYSEDGAMSTSMSTVRLYRGDALVATFNVPTNQGDGAYWNVFAVKNGEIVLKHTVTGKPDVSYAD